MCLLETTLDSCSELLTIGFLAAVLLALTLIENRQTRRRKRPRDR